MKPILTVFAAVLVLLLGQPVWARDEGKVIMTISAGLQTDFMDYILYFHSKDGEHSDYIRYGQHNWLFPSHRDFDDAQGNGVVKVLDLEPGDWQIDGFEFTTAYGGQITPNHEFAIPFTVKSGKSIYIGDYRVHVGFSSELNADRAHSVFVFFSGSDQSARDIPIAQKDDEDIKEVEVALPVIPPHTPYFAPQPPVVEQPIGGVSSDGASPSHP